MKYFGKRSLSSVVSVLLHVAWYVSLVIAACALAAGVLIVFHAQLGSPFAHGLEGSSATDIRDWARFQHLPLGVRILVLPYFGAIMTLVIIVIRKSRRLFDQFKNDVVFNKNNVRATLQISRLVIVLSIVTFSLGTLLVGIILRLLCEIMKNGTALQEEHELTV
jgi:hypothetical protein